MTFKTLHGLASKPDLLPSIPPLLSVLHSCIGGPYTLQYSNTGLTTVDSRISQPHSINSHESHDWANPGKILLFYKAQFKWLSPCGEFHSLSSVVSQYHHTLAWIVHCMQINPHNRQDVPGDSFICHVHASSLGQGKPDWPFMGFQSSPLPNVNSVPQVN